MVVRSSLALPSVCLRCRQATRAFSTGRTTQQRGPESPHFIDFPEPPQQTASYRPVIKGTLPVPRELFAGYRGEDAHRIRTTALSTRNRRRKPRHDANSFNEWKSTVTDLRKQNLREGLSELKTRFDRSNASRDKRSNARTRERQEAVERPEREDERLTTSSNNFDYGSLMRGEISATARARALQDSKERYAMREENKKQERLDHLHSLFIKATSFIVTPEHLDTALDESFGTDDNPVLFATDYGNLHDTYSIWARGRPMGAHEMLERMAPKTTSARGKSQQALDTERINKVAEVLTGGAFGE